MKEEHLKYCDAFFYVSILMKKYKCDSFKNILN
jgi:hypothetical protein